MIKNPISLPFRSLTVSGRVASGATTLSRGLADTLNWHLYNCGEIYRLYAKEMGIPLERTDLSSDNYHLKLDNYIKKKLNKEKYIIVESWLAGYDAQGIDKVFKIFVDCSDFSLRVDRLVNREKMTIQEAKEHLIKRESENLIKWKKLYGTSDFWNPKLYDLVIDTYKYGPVETLDLTLAALNYQTSKTP